MNLNGNASRKVWEMENEPHCAECGELIMRDESAGVWLHDPQEIGDAAFNLNEDHAPRPDSVEDRASA